MCTFILCATRLTWTAADQVQTHRWYASQVLLVLQRWAPGAYTLMRGDCPDQCREEGPLRRQGLNCRKGICRKIGGLEDRFPKWERLPVLAEGPKTAIWYINLGVY